jgi:hypothetical protein
MRSLESIAALEAIEAAEVESFIGRDMRRAQKESIFKLTS